MGDSGLVVTSLTSFPVAQPHSSVDDGSLYKHIDSEIPDPDRARQLIILCAARAPLPAPREGKDPPSAGEPSDKGAKLLQGLKENVLRLLAERKIDLNATSVDRPGSPANRSLDIRPNEQNVNNRARTTRFKDEIRMYAILISQDLLILTRMAEQSQRMTRGLLSRSFTILTRKQS